MTSTDMFNGPLLAAEGLRRLSEADVKVAEAVKNSFGYAAGGMYVLSGRERRMHAEAAHLRETGHALLLAAQTAAMLASGIHLSEQARDAWAAALAGLEG